VRASFAETIQANGTPALQALQQYMTDLENLRGRWRKAAELVNSGKIDDARVQLETEPTATLPDLYREAQRDLRNGAYRVQTAEEYKDRPVLAEWFEKAESPALAVKAFAAYQQAGGKLDTHAVLSLSRCLLDTGDFGAAANVLEASIDEHMASDWATIFRNTVSFVADFARNKRLTLEVATKHHGQMGIEFYLFRLGPTLDLWALKVPPEQEADKLLFLATLFERRRDRKGQYLALCAVPEIAQAAPDKASIALLGAGNALHESRDLEGAIGLWRRVAQDYPKTPSWGRAAFNIGYALKEQRKFQEAIPWFRKLLDSDVDDREPSCDIMAPQMNYRPRAQREIADCLSALGDYAAALEAYRANREKYPFQSWCGNCQAEFAYEYAFYEGLCLEYLGRYDEAARAYFRAIREGVLYSGPSADIRVADLYQAAGQIQDLKNMLQHVRSDIISRVLQIRELEKAQDWSALLELLHSKGSVLGPQREDDCVGNWEATEAARIIARNHPKTFRLLREHLLACEKAENTLACMQNRDSSLCRHAAVEWCWYALGLCGTPDAVSMLKERARREKNCWRQGTILLALGSAGALGRAALEELTRTGDEGTRRAIERRKEEAATWRDKPTAFPPIPRGIRLPSSL
jgi:tetratricopeptide (TPR) repeat protein